MLLLAMAGHVVRIVWTLLMPSSLDVPFLPLLSLNRLATLLLFVSFSLYSSRLLNVSSRRVSRKSPVSVVIQGLTLLVSAVSVIIISYYIGYWLSGFTSDDFEMLPLYKYDLYFITGAWLLIAALFLVSGLSLIRMLKRSMLSKSTSGMLKSNVGSLSPLIVQIYVSSVMGCLFTVLRGSAFLFYPHWGTIPYLEPIAYLILFYLPDVGPSVTISVLLLKKKQKRPKRSRATQLASRPVQCAV
ncbi:hypothetical protein KIPB_002818 [Kipferlia bialata]|uniref:THH1/TOM1/TOM3 domain-containing protein n=1 Tax=Kipferlia bialata TaxID=797122 RepID=A0A9K3CRA3_9EUKA|nr:hypothetical protein KIPB_002818 [Kipferlia bialata]|eukprot:g2818.t1